jgi:DNA replication licensing factor MCM2
MRLSEYCSANDIDRAIAVAVDSFVGSQKVSCKKSRADASRPSGVSVEA